MTPRPVVLLVASAALVVGCGEEPLTRALNEPVRVHDGQFHEGSLPGSAPLTAEEIAGGAALQDPYVTSLSYPTDTVSQGYAGYVLRGRATPNAATVALRFADVGSGYWTVPVSAPDPFNNDEYTWTVVLDLSPRVERGRHPLRVTVFDDAGRAGTQSELPFCVTSFVPDNLNSCNPKNAPPAAVLSLAWDTEVDLDLRVITPNGKIVDARHPSTALPGEDGKLDTNAPGTGVIDRDSNRNCISDGIRTENLVWKDKPNAGTYLVYANLNSACGESRVRFTASLYVSVPGAEPETFQQVQSFRESGQLHAIDANSGTKLGLFVTQFDVQ
jgi:hypothetical protein